MEASIPRTTRILAVLLLSLFTLGGCQNLSTCEGASTGLGALLGGVIGSQIGDGSGRTAAMVIGASMGGLIGREIGTRFTCEDRQTMGAVLDRTPDGESQSWRNANTGSEYTVTPQETFQQGDQQCRHFDMEVVVDGERRRTDGTACRRPDDQAWTTV
ncbi:RT0821/Lpp0805 family surface protein [Litchfieldella rifensis]|uniref:RT0821/Lpp0805 family surface protein n=1 Tax=Litchfieldella rifensis TaxID=762643 RepID=A0ABV7LPY7_9GAMM